MLYPPLYAPPEWFSTSSAFSRLKLHVESVCSNALLPVHTFPVESRYKPFRRRPVACSVSNSDLSDALLWVIASDAFVDLNAATCMAAKSKSRTVTGSCSQTTFLSHLPIVAPWSSTPRFRRHVRPPCVCQASKSNGHPSRTRPIVRLNLHMFSWRRARHAKSLLSIPL